jgi:hypothetical protein
MRQIVFYGKIVEFGIAVRFYSYLKSPLIFSALQPIKRARFSLGLPTCWRYFQPEKPWGMPLVDRIKYQQAVH